MVIAEVAYWWHSTGICQKQQMTRPINLISCIYRRVSDTRIIPLKLLCLICKNLHNKREKREEASDASGSEKNVKMWGKRRVPLSTFSGKWMGED